MVAKRSTKTEAKIRAALTELLPAKGIAGITVSDICRAASINRGTFYSHYTDKFDLMDQQIQRLADTLTQIVLGDDGRTVDYDGVVGDSATPTHRKVSKSQKGQAHATEPQNVVTVPCTCGDCENDELFTKDRVIACLTYVYENYEFINALTANGGDTKLKDFVKELIGELFEKSARARGAMLRFENDDYGREMLLSGITSVFWLWLSKGCPESPAEITEIVWTRKTLSPEELAGF